MKKTYKITLPKGAKVCTIDAKADDGVLNVTVNLEQKYVPKDGDIVYAQWGDDRGGYKWIFIYKEAHTDPYKYCDVYAYLGIERDGKTASELHFDDHCTTQELLRPATEREKKMLIDQLAKVNKRWNPNTKQIEDVRWRAKEGGEYYYIINSYFVVDNTFDRYSALDKRLYESGNYFKTREAAEKVATQIREIFKKIKS